MTAAAGRRPGAAAVQAIIGAERARMSRLYLAGGALAFEEGRMGVDQILAARRG